MKTSEEEAAQGDPEVAAETEIEDRDDADIGASEDINTDGTL